MMLSAARQQASIAARACTQSRQRERGQRGRAHGALKARAGEQMQQQGPCWHGMGNATAAGVSNRQEGGEQGQGALTAVAAGTSAAAKIALRQPLLLQAGRTWGAVPGQGINQVPGKGQQAPEYGGLFGPRGSVGLKGGSQASDSCWHSAWRRWRVRPLVAARARCVSAGTRPLLLRVPSSPAARCGPGPGPPRSWASQQPWRLPSRRPPYCPAGATRLRYSGVVGAAVGGGKRRASVW